jgi:hypothetical protein
MFLLTKTLNYPFLLTYKFDDYDKIYVDSQKFGIFFVNQLKYPFSTPCQSLEERCIPLSQHAHQNISLTKTSKQ